MPDDGCEHEAIGLGPLKKWKPNNGRRNGQVYWAMPHQRCQKVFPLHVFGTLHPKGRKNQRRASKFLPIFRIIRDIVRRIVIREH